MNEACSTSTTLLQHSCSEQLSWAVDLLLDAGCDPNGTSSNQANAPILLAAQHGNKDIIRSLMEHRRTHCGVIDTPSSGQTALHKVVQRLPADPERFLACLNVLLGCDPQSGSRRTDAKSLNVNVQDVSGNTPLHYAAHSGLTNFPK